MKKSRAKKLKITDFLEGAALTQKDFN